MTPALARSLLTDNRAGRVPGNDRRNPMKSNPIGYQYVASCEGAEMRDAGPVNVQIGRLAEVISVAEKVAEQLRYQLRPVSVPPLNQPEVDRTKPVAPEPVLCEVENDISFQRRRLEEVTDQLREILGCLRV